MMSLRQILQRVLVRKRRRSATEPAHDRRTTPERRRRPPPHETLAAPASTPLAARALLEKAADELSELLDSAVDTVITIDAQQRIVRFNAAASQMFGVAAADALGSHVERFIPERSRAIHREGVRRFAEGLVPHHSMGASGNLKGLRANGEEFPFEATIARARVGDSVRMTVIMRDITARVTAEAALRRSMEDLEAAVHGSKIGIWNWDFQSNDVLWSVRTFELFGLPLGEPMTFRRFLAAVHPDDRERVVASIDRSMSHHEVYRIECRILWPDGSVHWIQGIGHYLVDDSAGRAVGMRGIVLDISDRKEQEERLIHLNAILEAQLERQTHELKAANEALVQSNLELQQFAFIAAHDLQTPLRSISGFSQLLREKLQGHIDPQAEEWLNQLVRASTQMRDLIRDVLAYSTIDTQGEPFRATALNALFDDVAASFAATVQASRARVTRDDLPVVTVNRTQIGQVLHNLIDNALKYRGRAAPRIHVSARRQESQWLIAVEDNGIGIPRKHWERIFDVFHRLHTRADHPGTGIGLAICRRIVRRHGGRIWVESKPGVGSIFLFTLPDRDETAV